jgi:DNA polymerase-3 subunit delta'
MEVLGNELVQRILYRAVDGGQLHHSLLFHGPEGVGKRRMALRLAMYRCCPQREGGGKDCGGVCPSCSRMAQGKHPDLTELAPEEKLNGLIKIDPVTDLIRQAQFRPYEAPGRTFLFDGAERMTAEAANALLKTLEEPPSSSLFILIASRPDSLLPTIRSRCQGFRFRPFPPRRLEEALVQAFGIPAAEARLRARLAEGSLGRALSVDLEALREERELALRVLRTAAAAGWQPRQELMGMASGLSENKASWESRGREVPRLLASLLRDAILLQRGGDPTFLTHADLSEELGDLARDAAEIDPYEACRSLEEVEEGIRRNLNRRLLCELLFMKLARNLGAARPAVGDQP